MNLLKRRFVTSKALKAESAESYESFRIKATQELKENARLGFADFHRKDISEVEKTVWVHLEQRISNDNPKILDIGSGSSSLSKLLAHKINERHGQYWLNDSPEMLMHWQNDIPVNFLPGRFPDQVELPDIKFDFVLAYSVLQYALKEELFKEFVKSTLQITKPGGGIFLGDVPNVDMKSIQGRLDDNSTKMNFDNGILIKHERQLAKISSRQNSTLFKIPQPSSFYMASTRVDYLILKHKPTENRN